MPYSDKPSQLQEIIALANHHMSVLQQQKDVSATLAEQLLNRFESNARALNQYNPQFIKLYNRYRPSALPLIEIPSGDVSLIVNEISKVTLYNQDPVAQCRQQVEANLTQSQFSSINFQLDEAWQIPFIHHKYMTEMMTVFNEARQTHPPLTQAPEHLGCMLMFGVGLGYHLNELLDKVTIDFLYICEPNLDWFYASLFTCNWQLIFETFDSRGGSIHINLTSDTAICSDDFHVAMTEYGPFNAVNAMLYQHYPSPEMNQIIQQLAQDFHMIANGWGFFDDGLISIGHDYANAKKQIPALKKDAILPAQYQSIPAFIVANGPSLDDAIEVIKQHRDKVVLFSCGTAIQPLLDHDIVPDFHIEIERTRFTYDCLAELFDVEKMKQVNFLTANVMHPSCMDLFKWSGVGFKREEVATTIALELLGGKDKYEQLNFCNPVTANTACSFASHFGFDDIYLFGVDNGYKNRTQHHSKHSIYYNQDGEENQELGDLVRSGEVEVPGNFGGSVYTSVFLNTGRHNLELLVQSAEHCRFYNCSDGAKIEGAQPLHIEDVIIQGGLTQRETVVEHIKSEMFITRDFDHQAYVDKILFERFNEIADKLVGFIDRDFTSRTELSQVLLQQQKYMRSIADTADIQLYMLLQGTMNYVQAVFRMIQLGFADEQVTLETMDKAFEVFKRYIAAAKQKYQHVLEEVDDTTSIILGMFKQNQGIPE